MSYRKNYSTQEQPPFPCIDVTFINPVIPANTIDVMEVLADTGATNTFIPKRIIERLELIPSSIAKVYDFEKKEKEEQKLVYRVIVSFGPFNIPTSAIETDGDPIIGRDVINQFTAILRGRAAQMEMQK